MSTTNVARSAPPGEVAPDHGWVTVDEADSVVPADGRRMQTPIVRRIQAQPETTINIIYGDRARLPDVKPRVVSGGLALVLKAGASVALMVGLYYGPSYLACRSMKEQGLFYYGTTVSTCMTTKMNEPGAIFETLGRRLVPALGG